MQFDSVNALINMNGHGVFVWSVYGLVLIVLIVLIIAPYRKNRRFFIQQSMLLRRQQGLDGDTSSTPISND